MEGPACIPTRSIALVWKAGEETDVEQVRCAYAGLIKLLCYSQLFVVKGFA